MRTVKVLLADEHPIVLEGLREILRHQEFEITGVVTDGRALVRRACDECPDIIISDMFMPLLDGIQALREIRRTQKISKVIFFSMHHDASYAVEALKAGASGYILKTSSTEELLAG